MMTPTECITRELISIGIADERDIALRLWTMHLVESGIPPEVLDRHGDCIGIMLNANYHTHAGIEFHSDGMALTLSFDQLYDCFIPWASVCSVTLVISTSPPEIEAPVEPVERTAPKLELV